VGAGAHREVRRQGPRAPARREGLRLACRQPRRRGSLGVHVQRYLDQFQRFITNGAASAPEWVTSARKASILRFEAQGFPTTKDEDWHFTSPAPIADREFT